MADKDSNVELCRDGHRCENSSKCVEYPGGEGRFYCDCDESVASGGKVWAGLYCEHHATVYCTFTGKISHSSFCTNNGDCKGFVDELSEHVGCDCPKGYTGRHCQFVEGSQPEDYLIDGSSSNTVAAEAPHGGDGTGLGTAGLAVIILIAVAILGAGFARLRRHVTTHTRETTKSTDGHLHDADGENLASIPTKTFESDDKGEENRDDDLPINSVVSGQMA